MEPTPFAEAQQLAAEAWGARRTWFLVNGASQGNHVALLTLAHAGDDVVLQRNAHSSTVDALVLSGLRPDVRRARARPRAAHRALPDARDARPRARARRRARSAPQSSRRPTSARSRTWRALAEVAHAHGVPLIVDEAWGAHLAFNEDLPDARARRSARTW